MSKTKNVAIIVAVAGFRTVVAHLMGIVPVFDFRCVPSHTAATAATWTAPHVLALSCLFSVTCAHVWSLSEQRRPKRRGSRSTLCGGTIGVVDKA